MKNALAVICRFPNQIMCEFYNNVTEYDVFVIIDDESFTSDDNYKNIYSNITFVQICASTCLEKNIKNCTNSGTILKLVAGWDKALYYFMFEAKKEYINIWLLEDDVFIYDQYTLVNIDKKYGPHCDLLCNSTFSDEEPIGWHWERISIKFPPPYFRGMVCACRISQQMILSLKNYAAENETLFFIEALFPTMAKHDSLTFYPSPPEFIHVTWNKAWDFPSDFHKPLIYHPIKNMHHFSLVRDYLQKKS